MRSINRFLPTNASLNARRFIVASIATLAMLATTVVLPATMQAPAFADGECSKIYVPPVPPVPTDGSDTGTSEAIIRAVDTSADVGDELPVFNCYLASPIGAFYKEPICQAFDGDRVLTSTPPVGKYKIMCTGAEATNAYLIAYYAGTFTVNAKPVEPTPTASPTATPTQPAVVANKVESGKDFSYFTELQTASGINHNVAVQAAAGVFISGSIINIVGKPELSLKGSQLSFSIEGRSSSGTTLSRMSKSFTVIIDAPSNKFLPVFSADGSKWTPVQQLTSPELPTGVLTGFTGGGSTFSISTKVFGYFGLRTNQNNFELTAQPSKSTYSTTDKPQLAAEAQGDGKLSFSTSTSKVCSVSSAGIVTAKTVGTCSITAKKLGDPEFLDAVSAPLAITFAKTAATSSGSSKNNPAPSRNTGKTTVVIVKSATSDSLLLADPGMDLSASNVSISGLSGGVRLPLKKAFQLQISSLSPSTSYQMSVLTPSSNSIPLSPSLTSSRGVLTFQIMEFIKAGKYKIVLTSAGSAQSNMIEVTVG